MKQFWAFLRDASNSKFWLVIAALIIAGGMTVTIQIGRPPGPAQDTPPVIEGLPIEDAPPDVDGPEGWSGVESLQVTAAWAAQQPAFQLIHPDSGEPVWQDNANARVCQWETQAALIGGEIPPNVPQEIGDCTSPGAATAIERMQSGGGIRGPPAEFHEVSTMWLYGVGRVWPFCDRRDCGRARPVGFQTRDVRFHVDLDDRRRHLPASRSAVSAECGIPGFEGGRGDERCTGPRAIVRRPFVANNVRIGNPTRMSRATTTSTSTRITGPL